MTDQPRVLKTQPPKTNRWYSLWPLLHQSSLSSCVKPLLGLDDGPAFPLSSPASFSSLPQALISKALPNKLCACWSLFQRLFSEKPSLWRNLKQEEGYISFPLKFNLLSRYLQSIGDIILSDFCLPKIRSSYINISAPHEKWRERDLVQPVSLVLCPQMSP